MTMCEDILGLSQAALQDDDVLKELAASGADPDALAEHCKRLALTDVPRAVRLSESLVSTAGEGTAGQIRAMGALAHSLCYANRFEEALAVLRRASETARRLGDRVELATAQLASVQPLARLGRLAEAAAAAENARQAFASAGDTVRAAMADTNYGIVSRMSGDPEVALVHFDRASAGLGADPVRRATLESNRAEALLDLDQFADAAKAFRSALSAFESAGNTHAAAIVEGNLADLLSRQGRIGEALELFERARRRFERTEAPGDLARLKAEEAEALTLAGALPESLARYADAVEALDAAGLPREAARACVGQGLVLLRLGQLHDAETVLIDAQRRFRGLHNDVGAAEAEFVLASVLARLGRKDECAALLKRAGDALAGRPARRCLVHLEEAGLHLDCARPGEAEDLLRRARPLVEQLNLAPLRVRFEHTSARFEWQRGNLRHALAHFIEALNVLEFIRGTLHAERVRSAFVGASDDVYHDACVAALECGGADGLDLAFRATESMRSRAFLDSIGGHGREPETGVAPPEDVAEFKLLSEFLTCQEELNAIYHREGFGMQAPEEPAPSAAGRRRQAELERRLADVELRLETTRRVSHLVARPRCLAEIQESLGAGHALISFFRARDRLAAFVITRDAAEPHCGLAKLDEVASACRRLELQVGRALVRAAINRQDQGPVHDFDSITRSLYDLVIRPLDPLLQDVRRIGVVPFRELYRVPFAALHDGERRLIERCAIEFHPSATAAILIARRGEKQPVANRLLAVGVADEAAPEMEAEAREIAAAMPESCLLAGASATVERFLEEARTAAVIHIATHGIYESSNPLSARLRFSDRWLTARELLRAAVPGSKVVLAGCETGRSSSDTGEERYGLIRSLLAAGASEVLGSHWPLHDATARDLFVSLYRTLFDAPRGPIRLADAARMTQIEALRSGALPVHWGGLFTVGGV